MVYLLSASASLPLRPIPPQRRRTIIIGAGPTGISAAFHLGEHTLLLERRAALEQLDDHSHDFPPGDAVAERKALFIACSSTSEATADSNNLIHVARWQPPELKPEPATGENFESDEQWTGSSPHALVPMLRGELLFGAWVMRVSPSLHMLELTDGRRFVYDKLLCTVSLSDVTSMVAHELANRISHDQSLRYWLSEQDIEVADRANQFCEGDIDEIAAGKRVAAHISRALAGRFQASRHSRRRGSSFFEPRLVQATSATP